MKLIIEHDVLLNALSKARSVVEQRNTIPILGHVMLDANNSRIQICGTDLDIEVFASASAQVETAGSTTVSAGILHDIVRRLPKGQKISMAVVARSHGTEQQFLEIKSGRSNFSLHTLPQEDFPLMPSSEYETSFTMPVSVLQRMFNKIKHCIATDETRFYLNGIYMHVTDSFQGDRKVLRCVSTDGHQLGCIDTDLPADAANMPGIIVPRKTINEFLKLPGQEDAEVEISVTEVKIRFVTEDFILTSKVIDGNFPDYSRVIPKNNHHRMTINAADFAAAADRVAVVSSEKSRAIKLDLNANSLMISVNSDNNTANEELEITYDGEPMQTGYDVRFLLAVLSQIQDDSAILMLNTGVDPVLIHDGNDSDVLYIIMPVRI